ncbi:MAG: glycosyltransferase family 2 protein [Lachnospiraceae bacterium]|nr:glycosyltransferase family 2 protein [Lachnospiraceae bacterium]MDY5701534.1 glycosyltransferase family 2 protein [Lachnospiraceae bacterium]
MDELISIIVPVYNAEEYLQECIESILRQTYFRLEIILVDDCSEDGSPAICDEYAKKDERVHVIHRETKGGEGGAKARNTGMAQATGDLIYFIDSDDYIAEDMLECMYRLLKKEQSDCVVSSFHYMTETGEELPWRVPQLSDYKTMSGLETARIFLTTLDIEGFSWNKLFRRAVLEKHQINFDESMNSFVDMYGMFRAVLVCNRVSFYDGKPYYYRQRSASCIHTMDKRKLDNFKRVILQIKKLAEDEHMDTEAEFFYCYRMLWQLFDTAKAKKGYSIDSWKQIQKEYRWSEIFNMPLLRICKIIRQYLSSDRIKTGMKLLVVRFTFK